MEADATSPEIMKKERTNIKFYWQGSLVKTSQGSCTPMHFERNKLAWSFPEVLGSKSDRYRMEFPIVAYSDGKRNAIWIHLFSQTNAEL
jgi:hypothetical protein